MMRATQAWGRSALRAAMSSSSGSSSCAWAQAAVPTPVARLSRALWAPSARFSSSTDADSLSAGYGARVCTVLGAQWGDEGKGKLVDVLAGTYDIVARFNGGANAGHTLVANGKKFAFHLLPCGLLIPGVVNVIGNGVVVCLDDLFNELKALDEADIPYADRFLISNRAHMLFEFHKVVDGLQESQRTERDGINIGTTKRGIGPAYASKVTRNGIRMGQFALPWEQFRKLYLDLADWHMQRYGFVHDTEAELERLHAFRERVLPWITDTVLYVNQAIESGQSVLAEGANAALLDIDFGTYPFVTSSTTVAGGIMAGLGIAPGKLESTLGVVKAYTTRVGEGPFPSELTDEVGKHMGSVGHEFGATTARPRRCGWLDLPLVQYSNMLNGYTSLNLTKLDVLTGLKELKLGVAYVDASGQRLPPGAMPSTLEALAGVSLEYETLPGWTEDISKVRSVAALPENAQAYVRRIEEVLGVPVSWVGVGPGRDDMATNGFEAKPHRQPAAQPSA